MSKLIKLFLGALATILLGAIGSGFWEKILSPLLGYFANTITSTLSSISISYSDSIYQGAANLYAPNSSESTAITILFIIFIFLFIYAISSKKENDIVRSLHDALTKQFQGWFGIIQSGAMLIMVILLMSRQAAIEEIQRYSAQQMEIIRPYIEAQQYFQIRSDYLRIKNKADFDTFLEKLKSSAKHASIDIDEFKPR